MVGQYFDHYVAIWYSSPGTKAVYSMAVSPNNVTFSNTKIGYKLFIFNGEYKGTTY